MKEIVLQEIIGECTQANYTWTVETGFALYLDFSFDNKTSGTSFYVTELPRLEEIRQMLNKGKTGYAYDVIDTKALQRLIGKKAIIFYNKKNNQCSFQRWME